MCFDVSIYGPDCLSDIPRCVRGKYMLAEQTMSCFIIFNLFGPYWNYLHKSTSRTTSLLFHNFCFRDEPPKASDFILQGTSNLTFQSSNLRKRRSVETSENVTTAVSVHCTQCFSYEGVGFLIGISGRFHFDGMNYLAVLSLHLTSMEVSTVLWAISSIRIYHCLSGRQPSAHCYWSLFQHRHRKESPHKIRRCDLRVKVSTFLSVTSGQQRVKWHNFKSCSLSSIIMYRGFRPFAS